MTTATHNAHDTATAPRLFWACELSEKSWQRGCTIGHGQQPRERTMAARDPQRLREEVEHAKARVGLPATARVVSGYEAGRAGLWLQRFLQAQIMQFIAQWNQHAHPFNWSTKSVAKIMAEAPAKQAA